MDVYYGPGALIQHVYLDKLGTRSVAGLRFGIKISK